MKKTSVSLWLFLLITIIISAFIVIIPFLKLSERSLEKQTELYKEYNTKLISEVLKVKLNSELEKLEFLTHNLISAHLEQLKLILENDKITNLGLDEVNFIDIAFIKANNKIININKTNKEINKEISIVADASDKNILRVKINNEIYSILLVSKEIIDDLTKEVIGKIYLGQILNNNNNSKLLDFMKEKYNLKDVLIYDNEFLSQNSQYNELILDILANSKKNNVYINDDLIISIVDVDLNKNTLFFIFIEDNKYVKYFNSQVNNLNLEIFEIFLLLSILIYSLITFFIVNPLKELEVFASQITEKKDLFSKKSYIKEFNYLSDNLKLIIGKMRDTQERYELAIDGTHEGLWDWDIEKDIVIYSDKFNEILNNKLDDKLNTIINFTDFLKNIICSEHRDYVLDKLKEISNNHNYNDFKIEFRINTDSTNFKWIFARGKIIFVNNKIVRIIGFISDITKKKKLEAENIKKDRLLIQQSKLASIGEMINNIGHQWRQPLNVIGAINMKVSTQLEFGHTLDSKSYQPIAKDIDTQLENMSVVINNFKNFFDNKEEIELFDLNICMKEINCLFFTYYKEKGIYLRINSEKIIIKSYNNKLKQVLLNILNNSREAILLNKLGKGYININVIPLPLQIKIEIEDNAGGIPEDMIDKIFEPYITTKFKSQGTGLGLYISYKIVTEFLHGIIYAKNIEINYNNKLYKGSKITIVLPTEIKD